jgi:phosphoribosyl 1,2-cyclic phosphodiesterase
MAARFSVLASGSTGNAAVLEAGGFGLLIDCGLRPEILSEKLSAIGRTWANVSAVLLTHTHGDHWNRHTLAHLRRLNVPLVAHPAHHAAMATADEYELMHRARLTQTYDDRRFTLGPGWGVQPVPVPHDSDPTFGFRIDGPDWSVGYASDVGHPTAALTDHFAGVGLLALEFNHDVWLQKTSRRPATLINRVLGDDGHLSNDQAAGVTRRIATGGLQYLVQLHLSRECNRPELAGLAGLKAVENVAPGAAVVTAAQRTPTRIMQVIPAEHFIPRPAFRRAVQPALPGLGG